MRYRHNAKAWMTSLLFQDYLKDFDKDMRKKGRKVILLLDNAASHSPGDVKLTNVHLEFLPPNTTAHIQPMDAGIIRCFKAHYRRALVRHYIDCAEADQPQTVTIRTALKMTSDAWDAVGATVINNCFRHVRILPDANAEDDEDDEDDIPLQQLIDDREDEIPLIDLQRLLRQIPDALEAEAFISLDATEDTCSMMTDDDLVQLTNRDECRDESEESDEEPAEESDQKKDVTLAMMKDSLRTAIQLCEQITETTAASDENHAMLPYLHRFLGQMEDRTVKKQPTMLDFFKKK